MFFFVKIISNTKSIQVVIYYLPKYSELQILVTENLDNYIMKKLFENCFLETEQITMSRNSERTIMNC